MSLLSTFIRGQLLAAVEQEFAASIPDIQTLIVNEIQAFAEECVTWVKNKIEPQTTEEPQE